LAKVKKIWRSG